MQGVSELHIAKNLEDLKKLAKTIKLGKNPKLLEKSIKTFYQDICKETYDQEKCYIYCFRFLYIIETLCKIGDAKFINVFYGHEIARVRNKIGELKVALDRRYRLEQAKQEKENQLKLSTKILEDLIRPELVTKNKIFQNEFTSVREIYDAIQDNANILIVDIRPANEYLESKIKFENIINIPEDIIVAGLSANALGQKLKDDTQKIWDKRDTFDALVFLDWNSGSDNVTCTKLNYIKESVITWDCLRRYKQNPVVVDGGFKEFLDSYPGSVTNVHVNFIRNNEDIDELLELDSISYPEADQNVSIMPLKQFTIEELEESTRNEEQSDEESNVESANSQIDDISSSTSSTENINGSPEVLAPKGGGAAIDKPVDVSMVEPTTEIKNKIEEQRLKLLMEARNKKNKRVVYNDNKEKFIEEHVGDDPTNQVKKLPPPIRRETKPRKFEFVFGGWCGLVNIKNTCYMNTILQCLKCIPVIRNLLHSNYSKYITRHPPQILNEFASTIRTLCEGTENDKKIFKPSAFYDIVCRLDQTYKKGNHEDCMEFFLFLFNHLNDDCSEDIKKKNVMIEREKSWYSHLQGRTSFWVDLFYHQFKCTKICRSCHSKADSYETDNTLMLPVPYKPGLRMVHLKDLINEYLEDNQILDYKCSKCQHLGVINKKEVVVAPEILVLVLKRYYQDEYQETRKNNVCVDFDSHFKFGNNLFRLYSIAEHRGTMEHGHYFAHGLINDSVWAEFNDERTLRHSGDWEAVMGSACAFFYCKDNRRNA